MDDKFIILRDSIQSLDETIQILTEQREEKLIELQNICPHPEKHQRSDERGVHCTRCQFQIDYNYS